MRRELLALLKGPGVRFAIVGGSLTVLDLLLYQLLANVLRLSLFGVSPGVSAVWIGVPIVVTINFFVSHRFVWRSAVSKAKTIVPFFGLNLFSGVFVQSAIVGLLLHLASGLEWTIGHGGAVNFVAKCIAVGVGMIINFFGARFLFKWDSEKE